MRRIEVSDSELSEIRRLRQAGASWLAIEAKTSVPRRTAKRAYEGWQQRQSLEELRAARVHVATEAFRDHVDSMIRLAEYLATHLPDTVMFYETRDAEQVLRDLWKTDISNRRKQNARPRDIHNREKRRIARSNSMVFESLETHTQGEAHWQILQDWRRGWDSCRSVLADLRSGAGEQVGNILGNQERDISDRILHSPNGKSAIGSISEGVVEALWQAILDGKPEDACRFISTRETGKGTTEVVFRRKASVTAIDLADREMAEKVVGICRRVANNLYIVQKDAAVSRSRESIRKVGVSVERLTEMLSPVELRPVILRTRCRLCPA